MLALALLGCTDAHRASLEVWRQTSEGRERLVSGAWAAPGDVVQVVYRTDLSEAGAIWSVDGRGVVTEHLPTGPLHVGRTPLDHAFRLDDAPSFERFYLLVGDPEDLDRDVDALRAGAEPPPSDVAARFELLKEGSATP